MVYEAYGNPQRGNGEPGYFEPSGSRMSDSSSQYNGEPQDESFSKQRAPSSLRQSNNYHYHNNMTSAPERTESSDTDVSPELIAAITERVKRELVEHLKHTSSVDEQNNAPSMERVPSNKSSSTSSPPPTSWGFHTPPSPTQATKPLSAIPQPMEPARSPPSSPLEKPSGVRFSDRTLPTRPGVSRTFSTVELSAVDQKWGRLIDNEGKPTQRLGQFLRGLANHIIDEFFPRKTIVVTPAKMAAYYASHALEKEIHPLVSIFRAQSNEQISKLYQDLGCQHHLIQDSTTVAPTIPSLTPVGFAHWMTINILAYPEEESQRLEKVVSAMPIDADGEMVDGKPERLPKQISRHLLPEKEDRKAQRLVENAISNFFNDLGTSSRRKASIAPTPPSLSRHSSTSNVRTRPVEIHQARISPTTSKAQPLEKNRNPYTSAPSVSESSSNDETIKIERERQPYTAQPGNGKIYAESTSLNAPPRLGRANSTSTRPREIPDYSGNRHRRSGSNASQNYVPPLRASGRRTSSPPLRGYSSSTPDDIGGYRQGPPPSSTSSSFTNPSQGFIPSSYSSTSSVPPPLPVDIRDKRTREDRQYGKRGTEEESRLVGEFNSPRDAERWDRFQETRAAEPDRSDRSYQSKPSVSVDPRDKGTAPIDIRGDAFEEWYKEPAKNRSGYEGYGRH